MFSQAISAKPDNDADVDTVIKRCLNPQEPKSFFLYAGAGSGKTYSLVEGLKSFERDHGAKFRRSKRQIAVITYTNAACNEILGRVQGDPLFHISTIHSFCWLQIKFFHDDIRTWLIDALSSEISSLQHKENKGRPNTKESASRQRKIARKEERLAWLSERREFTYNPNGENSGKSSLSHTEVLKICADFLVSKPSFQQIVINCYPFILIDESQDTNKHLIEAFFLLEFQHQNNFGIGLIGDMMQRIFGDGKADLGSNIPDWWLKPAKQMNHRCPQRIVTLANSIRFEGPSHYQKFVEGNEGGHVRFFIESISANRKNFESFAKESMREITEDPLWCDDQEVKHLMLEHKMAAVRMGFSEMWSALYPSRRLITALSNGDLPAVRLFSEYVFPLYQLEKKKDSLGVMAHLRRAKSPLLTPDCLKKNLELGNPLIPLKNAINELVVLIDSRPNVSFEAVLKCVAEHKLFVITSSLAVIIGAEEDGQSDEMEDTDIDEENEEVSTLDAIQNFLNTPFNQIEAYRKYVLGQATFDTHQGVKGREFDRVMVVMDDEDAGGFLFSYEKMFGVKPLTKNDLDRQKRGEETGMERTKRLFYVTCTRAKKSLALVAYSQDPPLLKKRLIEIGWFEESEVILGS